VAATTERRKIALMSADRRIDVAIPLDETLGDALSGLGYTIQHGHQVVLDRTGNEARLGASGADLQDGALFAIVDLHQVGRAPDARAAAAGVEHARGALWWLLGTVAVLLSGGALLAPAGTVFGSGLGEVLAGLFVGLGAAASALAWAVRRRRDATAEGLAMLAPLALAFAAGVLVIPKQLVAGDHLAVVTGLLAAGVVAALLTATVNGGRLRSAAGTATIILLVLAAVWGLTLLAGWGMPAAAAVSAGAVAPALRFLPTTLVNVQEGYHIDYRHFMSNRWTVRGAIPETPDTVSMAAVREIVNESSARLLAGTVLLSVLPVVTVPLALTAPLAGNPFALGGTIAFLVALVVALVLAPRHNASPVLRWVPRAAAAVVLLEVTVVVSGAFGVIVLLLAASGLLLVGVVSAALIVPIGRGSSSLVWSRMADILESFVVALAFPAALLASDILSFLRGVMAS
jgi:hypothetical protein